MSDLPNGWVLSSVGDILAGGLFVDGDWVESKDQDPDGNIRLLQLADVGEGAFRDRSNRFINDDAARRLSVTFVEPGDVLVARMPDPIGRACLAPDLGQRAITAVDICIMRPGTDIEPRWLMWVLNAPATRRSMATRATGTTRKRISRKNLATIELSVPPLAEQRRIVGAVEDTLTRLDAAEINLTATRRRLDIFRRSAIATLFDQPDWPWTTIGEVADLIRGVSFRKADASSEAAPGLVPIARAGNVEPGRTRLEDDLLFVPAECVSEKQYLRSGDVLIATSSGSASVVGKSAVIADDWHGAHGAFMGVLRAGPRVVPRFLGYYVQSHAVRERWWAASAGTAINNLKKADILETSIPLTPQFVQEGIVEAIEEQLSCLERLQAEVDRADAHAKLLRRALLAAAFTGRLLADDREGWVDGSHPQELRGVLA